MTDPVTSEASALPDAPRVGGGPASQTVEYPTGSAVITPAELSPNGGSSRKPRFRAPATYLLLGINVAVFAVMRHAGVDLWLPDPQSMLRFGANQPDLVLGGEWWRIVTAMFVHVGAIHLATNMWCLWNLGLLGEPLLGFFGVIAVYLLTGAAGNLLSLANSVVFQNFGQVGAGASGAVFGIAGILIVLLSNKALASPRGGQPGIPLKVLSQLRRSVISFAAVNLVIGLGTIFTPFIHLPFLTLPDIQIDNMAHLGGFSSGLAMGLPLLSRMTSGRQRYLGRQRITFAASALVLALLGTMISKLRV